MTRRVDQLNWDQLSAAAESWQLGGSLALGAWAAKNMPRFTTADYGALVQEVRDFLGDDTDYSQQPTVATTIGGPVSVARQDMPQDAPRATESDDA